MGNTNRGKHMIDGNKPHNFCGAYEIMVSVTLDEYRDLVETKGRLYAQVGHLCEKVYNLEEENKKLSKRVEELEREVDDDDFGIDEFERFLDSIGAEFFVGPKGDGDDD